MRLGIRRKLIGTLMLVGLLPLALSLAVILIGGATMRLHSIHNAYEHKATDSSNQLAGILIHELEKLEIIARLPQVRDDALAQTESHRLRRKLRPETPPATQPDDFSQALDAQWPRLGPDDPAVRAILNNSLAERLAALVNLDAHPRECLATDAFGEVIAADVKPSDYFQGDEEWWAKAFADGQGRPYISTVTINPTTGTPVVAVAVPIYDQSGQRLVGIIKDKIDVSWFRQPLLEVTTELQGSTAQLFDALQGRTVLLGQDNFEDARRAEASFLHYGSNHQSNLLGAMFGDLVVGTAVVPIDHRLPARLSNATVPKWVVIISKPAQEAMVPVYGLAVTVAAIGIAVILILFILGVAISNREIITPIFRLREATAAVGRGDLNVRLISEQNRDGTFRADELGELAHDFDEMTRELQKNLGKLARANQAKLRFMELAGHELRTPVTYIIGVCQLAQRQLQAAQQQVGDESAGPNTATLVRNTTAVAASLTKIIAKAQRLSRIIDNLLKLVQNDQFTTRVIKTPVDMRALILQVCNDARPFINERKQQLLCDVAENLPSIDADRDKLEDALTNLLTNAIRFSPDGSTIKVTAHVVVGDMLEILVEDAGPGISAADAANLFEPFYTGSDIMHHHSGTIEYGSKGIGLGLAVVRRFIEVHGGVVRAHPVVQGQGTQFQILLPISARDGQIPAAAAAGPAALTPPTESP